MPSALKNDYSFVNNFWDKEGNGVTVIGNKFASAKHTFDELNHFYKERIQLEEEYGRRMNGMTRKATIGATEENNTNLFFESLRLETDQMSKAHLTQAAAISNEVHKPLENFISSFKARKSTIEATIMKVVKYKKALATKLEAARSKYENECLRFRAMSADKLLLDGNELRRLTVKLDKCEASIRHIRQEYYELYKEAVEIHERFIREWKLALVKYQELEEERIKFLRSNIWTYCNLVSISCVNVDTSCENIRVALEKCEAKREVEAFTKKHKTGNEIPGLPKFIDYINPAATNNDLELEERPTSARFNNAALPSMDSYATVKINKKAPPRETSEETNTLLMLGKRSNETRQAYQRQFHEEEQEEEEHAAHIVDTPNTKLNPPESEYSEPSTSQNNSHNSSQYPHSSHYSDATEMSVHNEAAAKNGEKHWNSPQRRRRSRGSIQGLSDYSSSIYEPTSAPTKAPGFTLPREESTHLVQDDDVLRSTLRDLQMGGNGSAKRRGNGRMAPRPKSMLLDSQVPKAARNQAERPKSMLLDNHVSWSPNPKEQLQAAKSSAKPSSLPKIGPLTGRPVIKYCKAIYSYKAKEEDECSFKKRDIILVLEDGELWWSVEVLGKNEVGQAPSNYLAPI